MRSNLDFFEDSKRIFEFITDEYNKCCDYERLTYDDRGLTPKQQFQKIKISYIRTYTQIMKIDSLIKTNDHGNNHSPIADAVRTVVESIKKVLMRKLFQLNKLEDNAFSPEQLEKEKNKYRELEEKLSNDFNRMCGEMNTLKYFSPHSLQFFTYNELITHEECLINLRADLKNALIVELNETNKKGFFNKPNLRLVKEKWDIPLNKVNAVWLLMNNPYKSRVAFSNIEPEEMNNITAFEFILREYVKDLSQYIQWQSDFYGGLLNKKISMHELSNNNSPYYLHRIQLFHRYEEAEKVFDAFRKHRIEHADELVFE